MSITRSIQDGQCNNESSGVVESVITIDFINSLGTTVGECPSVVRYGYVVGASASVEGHEVGLVYRLVGPCIGYRIVCVVDGNGHGIGVSVTSAILRS